MDSTQVLNWLLPALAVVATVVGTMFISRRSAQSTFMTDVMRELEYYKAKNRELEKRVTDLDGQCRELGRENVQLLRDIARLSREDR